MYCNIKDGKKISMPRYYKDKLYEPEQRKAVGFFQRQNMIKNLIEYEKDPMYYTNKFESDKVSIKIMLKNKNSITKNKI